MKKKGYTEGIDQIENTPEIAAVEEDVSLPVTPQVAKKVVEKAVVEKVETPKTGKRKAAEMETTPATRYTWLLYIEYPLHHNCLAYRG